MDAMVTSRVPASLKAEGNSILADIGSSPTELINAAYRYIVATRELPTPTRANLLNHKQSKRRLTADQKHRIAQSLTKMQIAQINDAEGEDTPAYANDAAFATRFNNKLAAERDMRYADFA